MKSLLDSLTLEEKIGQLTQISPFFFIKDLVNEVAGPALELGLTEKQIFLTGSVLGINSAKEMIEVQTKYLAKSRHKIPLMFMADVVHGCKTIFPVPLGLSSSWNPSLAEKAAEISAKEAQTSGIHVTFAPMADISREPRWGRVVEGFGEDPYLTGQFSSAMVKGFQQEDLKKVGAVASCVKHFAAYGAAEAGRDYNTVDMSRLSYLNYYHNGYKKAIEANCQLVMTSFNVFESVPSTANKYLLDTLLRKEMHFKGVTISDYASLKETIQHRVAKDAYEAAIKGKNAGLDIEMATSLYMRNLPKALENGDITIDKIDEAVLRILELKKALGLFENPFKGADELREKTDVLTLDYLNAAREIAEESIVLLKNENHILPLKKNQKVALIGPYAANRSLIGPWSWHGNIEHNHTIEEVLKKELNVVFTLNSENLMDYNESVLNQIQTADVILMALGETARQSGEAHSRSNIHLPNDQAALVHKIKALGKPIVLILTNGRPLILTDVYLEVDGLLETYFLGTQAAEAITNILIGKVNPSGKLTMSFPRSIGQIPIYYNYLNTGRPKGIDSEYASFYLDESNDPLFPFGFGLSYSEFQYQNLNINKTEMTPKESLLVTVDIQNLSNTDGLEVVELYIEDHFASISRPVKELKGFQKVLVKKNDTVTVTFNISIKDLTYINEYFEETFDYGSFSVLVGSSSIHYQKVDFHLVKEK